MTHPITRLNEDQIEAIIDMFELEMYPEVLAWTRTKYITSLGDVWTFVNVLINGMDDRPYIATLLDGDDICLPPIRVGIAAEMKAHPRLAGAEWTWIDREIEGSYK